MKIKLQCIQDISFIRGRGKDDYDVKVGDIVDVRITDLGVNVLIGNCWSMDYDISSLIEYFKVYGQ